MRRREFIRLLGGAVAWPFAARAQQPAMPVVGVLAGFGQGADQYAFRQGLSEVDFVDGRNVAIEFHFAQGQNDRFPAMAADLARREVSVIAAFGIPAITAARTATAKIPIVFVGGFDPVAIGFVASLNRPGGNLTGVTTLALELGPKRLQLLHELVPAVSSIALLANPANPVSADAQSRDLQAAARTLGLPPLHVLHASSEHDFEAVFGNLVRLKAGGLVIANDAFFNGRSEQLGALTLRHAMPTIFQFREFAAAGGLLSYGSISREASRLVGVYAGRILKGESAADLPVQQSAKVELVINLKSANTLGLAVPLSLRSLAHEVIE